MKTFINATILSIAITIIFSTSVLAGNGYCGYKGCQRSTKNCHNGTVYCDIHAAVYAKKSGYKVCAVGGCFDVAASGSRYCSFHICRYSKCDKQSVKKGGYCVEHECLYPGCDHAVYYTEGRYMGYCNTHAWQLHDEDNNSNSSNSGIKTKPSDNNDSASNSNKPKKEEYDMPDCDDYDSFEEFMDDWDGCMPDGSDAEDYWDNW